MAPARLWKPRVGWGAFVAEHFIVRVPAAGPARQTRQKSRRPERPAAGTDSRPAPRPGDGGRKDEIMRGRLVTMACGLVLTVALGARKDLSRIVPTRPFRCLVLAGTSRTWRSGSPQ